MRVTCILGGILVVLLVVVTSDAQWTKQNSGTTNDLNDVAMTDSLTAVCVGSGECIIRTSDAGATWVTVHQGTSHLYGVCFANRIRGFAGGDSALLFTDDGGVTWTERDSGITTGINGVRCVDTSQVIAVGSPGYFIIYKTTDAGRSWLSKYVHATGSGVDGPYPGLSVSFSQGPVRGNNGRQRRVLRVKIGHDERWWRDVECRMESLCRGKSTIRWSP